MWFESNMTIIHAMTKPTLWEANGLGYEKRTYYGEKEKKNFFFVRSSDQMAFTILKRDNS